MAWQIFGVASPCHERFLGQSREGLSEWRSGLKTGDFVIRSVPLKPLSRREMLCSCPLLFLEKIFRHNHNGRVFRFRVQSSLGCDGEKTRSPAPFSNDSQASLDPWS